MAKKVSKANKVNIEVLLEQYDRARAEARAAKDSADDLNAEIKLTLGATEEVDTPAFVCTYYFDKDKDVESFDEAAFATKEPRRYKEWQQLQSDLQLLQKKYTKITTVKGARKLIVTRKNEEGA